MLETLSGDLFFKLKLFHLIMQYGSMTKAASKVNRCPSSISRQIQQLEDELGTTLFLRDSGGVRPTSEGKRLYSGTLDIFRSIELMLRSFEPEESPETLAGTVRLLVAPVMQSLLSTAVAEIHQKHPGITIDLISGWGVEASYKIMAAHDCHAAIVAKNVCSGTLDFEELVASHMCLVAPADTALPPMTASSPQALSGLTFISAPENLAISRFLRGVCGEIGLDLNTRHRASSLEMQLIMVEAGLGCAVMDSFFLRGKPIRSAQVVRLGFFPERHLGIVQRRGAFQPPHVKAVLDILRSHAGRIMASGGL